MQDVDNLSKVPAAALIAHITSNSAPSNAKQFTFAKDYAHAIDPEHTPDYRLWLEATRKEYELLDKTMGCWEVVIEVYFASRVLNTHTIGTLY